MGTVSSAGLYTAPATVTIQQTVTVKAVLSSNSAVTATATVTLMPPAASSTYSVTASISGSSLKVSWTAPSGASSGDRITLASPGMPDWSYVSSQATKGATSGTYTVAVPSIPGLYQFRYYKGSGSTPAATSGVLPINVAGFSVTPSPSTVSRGSKITVSWTAPAGRPGNWGDTIALYKVGTATDTDNAVSYVYPQGSQGGTTSGTYTVTAPSASGSYEFRYVVADGSYIAAVISPLTVQ